MVALETVSAVLAESNYSRIRCGSLEHLDHRRLREWQKLLADFPVQRLDRSTLLRIDHIESIQPHGAGCLVFPVHSPRPVELGRTATERLREILEQTPDSTDM